MSDEVESGAPLPLVPVPDEDRATAWLGVAGIAVLLIIIFITHGPSLLRDGLTMEPSVPPPENARIQVRVSPGLKEEIGQWRFTSTLRIVDGVGVRESLMEAGLHRQGKYDVWKQQERLRARFPARDFEATLRTLQDGGFWSDSVEEGVGQACFEVRVWGGDSGIRYVFFVRDPGDWREGRLEEAIVKSFHGSGVDDDFGRLHAKLFGSQIQLFP